MLIRRSIAALVLGLTVLGAGGASDPALAHDHEPPRSATMVLMTGMRQRGREVEAAWARRRGELCLRSHDLRIYGFPTPVHAVIGPQSVRFHLPKRQKPVGVSLRSVRIHQPALAPIDDAAWETAALSLHPIRGRKRRIVAWEGRWAADLFGDHHVELRASWRDRRGCGVQSVFQTFRVQTWPFAGAEPRAATFTGRPWATVGS